MSGHRLSRLLAPSPRGRPYVLISIAKLLLFSLIAKKIEEIFKKYLILLIFNQLQREIFRVFRGKTF